MSDKDEEMDPERYRKSRKTRIPDKKRKRGGSTSLVARRTAKKAPPICDFSSSSESSFNDSSDDAATKKRRGKHPQTSASTSSKKRKSLHKQKRSSKAKKPSNDASSASDESSDDDRQSRSSTSKKAYIPEFHQNGTGRKCIHPSALRFALGTMEAEAVPTAESITKSLMDNGEMEEGRRVQVRSSNHVQAIVTNVRKRLRQETVPTKYAKIEDLCNDYLERRNAQRIEEVNRNQRKIPKLEKQKASLEAKYKSIQHTIDPAPKEPIHPLVKQLQSKRPSKLDTSQGYRPAPKGSLLNILEKIPSPYENL